MTETKQIPLKLLLNNTGQIEGLPRNPRQIRDEQYKRLLTSLQESDLTDFKPLLVYPHKDKYIVLGGNMRLRALRELGADDVSCIVVPADTPLEQLKKVVILDNSQFGEYDWDIIANEWGDEPLQDWGLDVPVKENDEMPTDIDATPQDKPYIAKITFLSDRDCQGFYVKYGEILKTEYNAIISISGGGL